MSPYKRKITVLNNSEDNDDDDDDDNTFKHRRSSLRVNLSCTPNLSDSGNGSLKQIEAENSDRSRDRLNCNEKLLQCRVVLTDEKFKVKSHSGKNKITNTSQPLSKMKKHCLQNTGVTVEDINSKEQVLDINCRRLKDAILMKTKEIFDKENELSQKTIMILDSSECMTKILGSPQAQHAIEEGNEIIMSDKTPTNPLVYVTPKSTRSTKINTEVNCTTGIDIENKKNTNTEDNSNPNVITTPKNNNSYKSINNPINKFRLSRKKLFTDKETNYMVECNDSSLKNTYSQLSIKHIDNDTSPILSGSNKRFHISKMSLRTLNKQEKKNKKNKNIFIAQNNGSNTLIASMLEDTINSPVGCSTFIEDNTEIKTKESKNNYRCVNDNANKETHINDNFKSTQVTEIQNVSKHGTKTFEENIVLLLNESNEPNINKIRDKTVEQETRMEIQSNSAKLVQKTNTLGKSMDQSETSKINTIIQYGKSKDNIVHKSTNITIPMELTEVQENIHLESQTHNVESQSKRTEILISKDTEDSIKTIRSSLHVNTSIDMVREVAKNDDKQENCQIYESNLHQQNTKNNTDIQIPESEEQSINIVRMSLQVNTSLDAIHKSSLQRSFSTTSNEKLSSKESIQKTKNVETNSTVQALRTIESNFHSLETINLAESLKDISQGEQTFSNISTVENVSTKTQSEKNISTKEIDVRNADKNKIDESYIKGTPYPVGRTILFKSQIKCNTVIQKINVDEPTLSSNIYSLNKTKNSNNENTTSKPNIHITQSKSLSKQIVAINETQKKTIHNTIILDDSPSITSPAFKSQELIIIEDSSIADEEQGENVKDTISNNSKISEKRHKRKLLPLSENSQAVSFSPIQEEPMPSKKIITKHKKPRKRFLKKKVKSKEQNADNSIHTVKETAIERSSSEDVFENFQIKRKDRNEEKNNLQKKERKFQNVQSVTRKSSLNDFEARKTTPAQRHRKSQKIVIVTTGLSKEDKDLVKSVVKALGTADMEFRVSKRTTHVVSTGVRTVNLLHGIIRGCWLVSLEWVLKSLESNKWLDPKEYEMIHFSKAVKENRKDRQLFGTSYTPELFATCGFIYIENGTNPPCNVLKELIKIAGGRITEDPQVAKIIIGIEGLKETWILDSVTTGELQSFNQYQKKTKNPI